MPDWVCAAGHTILVPSGHQGNHLFIILTDPIDCEGYQPQSCIFTSICTIRKGPYDKTCILEAGMHPFVKDNSYIAYRHARFEQARVIEQYVQSGLYIANNPIDSEMLVKIITGIKDSIQTPNYLKELI